MRFGDMKHDLARSGFKTIGAKAERTSMHTDKNLTELQPISWISAIDLANFSATSTPDLWEKFCDDARNAMGEANWDGAPWQFAIVSNGVAIELHDAWDMKTGLKAQPDETLVKRLYYPATWNSDASSLSKKFADALHATLCTSHSELTAWGSEACRLIVRKVEKFGCFANLSIAIAHIRATRKDLAITMKQDNRTGEIYITAHRNDPIHLNETVTVKVRLLFGQLKDVEGSWNFSRA